MVLNNKKIYLCRDGFNFIFPKWKSEMEKSENQKTRKPKNQKTRKSENQKKTYRHTIPILSYPILNQRTHLHNLPNHHLQ